MERAPSPVTNSPTSRTQHSAHRLIGGVIAPGDLAQRLPLGDPLQDGGPLGRRNFEEGNGWVGMRWLGRRRL